MVIQVDESGTLAGLQDLLQKTLQISGIGSCLILGCDANQYRTEELSDLIRGKPVFGGIFPQILAGGKRLDRGAVILGLPVEVPIFVVSDLGKATCYPEKVIESWGVNLEPGTATLMAFVDGFSVGISPLIEALFNQFGLEINFLGGGCGSLNLTSKPSVISPEGLLQDAAVLAFVPLKSGVGVAHGWEEISGAFKVTGSSGNTIETLDWRPAFDVYREVVEKHGGRSFGQTPFFDLAKAYPFGIAKFGGEMVVRDPLMIVEKNLVCVGRVPQESFVHVLHGSPESLLRAARKARELASSSFGEGVPATMLFIDCISRVLFLGEDFDKELEMVSLPGVPMVGALTIGEIANSGRDFLEFYNKTSVVALLASKAG